MSSSADVRGAKGAFGSAAGAAPAGRSHRPLWQFGLVIVVAALMALPLSAITEPPSIRNSASSVGAPGSEANTAPATSACSDALTFQASGLPSGTNWSVGLGKNASGCGAGLVESSDNSTITFDGYPGTYHFYVYNVSGSGPSFVPVPQTGVVTLAGPNVTLSVTFVGGFPVTFNETELASGTEWSASLLGPQNLTISSTSQGTSLNFTDIRNGTYTFTLSALGYTATPASGTLTVSGAEVTQSVLFAAALGTFVVQFGETGLRPAGATWTVELSNSNFSATEVSTSSTISFRAPDGIFYRYAVSVYSESIYNLNPSPSSGVLNVTGAGVNVSISIRPSYRVTFTETGLAGSACLAAEWSVTMNGSSETSYGSSLIFYDQANGSFEFNASATACSTTPSRGVVNVTGADTEVAIVFGAPTNTQRVTFRETGLPTGTYWVLYIRQAGSYSSTNDTIAFDEPNGTYNYTPEPYDQDWGARQGTFSVQGGPVTVNVSFHLVNTVTFNESGLPVGTFWWANLTLPPTGNGTPSGAYSSGSSGSAQEFIDIPNGSYTYSFGTRPPDYIATPSSGTLTLTGTPVNVSISFAFSSEGGYPVTFVETGLTNGTNWSAALSGGGGLNLQGASNGTARVNFGDVPNGTYSFTVNAASYTPTPTSGTLTVAGSPVTQAVNFMAATGFYRVTFNETGLYAAVSWGVKLVSHSNNSTNSSNFTSTEVSRSSSIVFLEANGTYSFTVGGANLSVEGYAPFPSAGTVDVSGANVNVAITMRQQVSNRSVSVGAAPWGLAYASSQGEIFVADECGGTVGNISVINDTTDQVVAWVNAGGVYCGAGSPWNMAYDSAKAEVFVANFNTNNVTVISAVTNKVVANIPVGAWPSSIVYDSGTNQLFVTDTNGNNVSVISDATDKVVATIPVGSTPQAAVYDPGTHRVFVFNDMPKGESANTVSVISDATDKVVATIPAPGFNIAAAYDPATNQVFFAGSKSNGTDNHVGVISDSTDKVVATVDVGEFPDGIAYDPANDELYTANGNSNNVSAIYDGTDKVVATLPAGSAPAAVVFDTGTSQLFVANSNGSNVTILPIAGPTGVNVTFTESGIPAKMLSTHGWAVNLDGTRRHSTNPEITFAAPNGTDSLLITGPSGYATEEPGTWNVSGPTSIPVAFTKEKTVALTFGESGLPKGQSWCVEVDGAEQCATKATLAYANLTPGTYGYALRSPLSGETVVAKVGTMAVPTAGNLTVAKAETLKFTFVYPYAVTFTQAGHPNGTWSITIKGKTLSNDTSEPIVFYLPNGTYSYKVGPVTGYAFSGSPPGRRSPARQPP